MTTPKSVNEPRVLQDIQDATPSWSGYNHQGKVALYLALRTINELNAKNLGTNDYALEIESLEDVAILKEQDYQSLHQVKSYKSQVLSAYQDAIWILLNKSASYSPTEGVYLHTAKPISEPTKDQIKGLSASVNIQLIRKRVLTILDSTYPTFQLYPYSTQSKYCSLLGIDKEIDDQIHTYFTWHGLGHYNITKKRLSLLNIIHSHVMDRHAARQATKHKVNELDTMDDASPRIAFAVFEKCLAKDHEMPNDFYLLCELKQWFAHMCDEYINDQQEDGVTELDNLIQGVALINALSYGDFHKFCRKVNPHMNWPSLDLTTFKDLFERTSTRESLLFVLEKVTKQLHRDQFTYESNNKFYLPTTIHGGPYDPKYENNRKRMAKDILSNSALDEILMEVHTFISSHMEMSTIQQVAGHAIEGAYSDVEGRNRITRLGPINMITASQAVKEIE